MARIRSLIRGAALGVVAGVIVLALVLLLGLASSGSRLVFLVGAVAGGVFGLIPSGERPFEIGGVFLVEVAAIASGFITGWGWLEYSVLAGSVLALIWLVTGERRLGAHWSWFRWGGVLLVLLVFVLLPLIINGGTLGHDEAAYAVKAKSWLEGTPATGWAPHRGTGMSVYGYLILAVGGVEPGLRTIGLMGVLGLTVGVWMLGNLIANPRVGALAAVGVIAGPSILRRSSEYLSDVPSAALLVCCMVIAWREFGDRDHPTYRLLWLLPFAWAAFYLRYQSILSLGLIALVVVMLWWRKVIERPGPVVAVVIVGLFGLIPHAIEATNTTGSPLGILTYTGEIAERAYVGQGIVDYLTFVPWGLAGFVGPIAALAALGGLASARHSPALRERFLFLLVPAGLQVLALGLLSHGEPRFVFFPLALGVVAGVMAIDRWVLAGNERMTGPIAWGLAVLLVGSLGLSAGIVRRSVENRARVNLPVQLAAEEVRSQAGSATCGVLTTLTPQVTYYSECASRPFVPGEEPQTAVALLDGPKRFMVLIEHGRRQPEGDDLKGLVALTEGQPVIIPGALDAHVYAFAD
jgi:hypothetical protein